jgi:hypothetical protein
MRVLALTTALLVAVSVANAQAQYFSDNFSGTSLNARWISTPSAADYTVSGGLNAKLCDNLIDTPTVIDTYAVAAPTGDYVATMKVSYNPTGSNYGLPQVGIGAFSADHQSLVMTTYQRDFEDGPDGAPSFATKVGGPISGGWPYGLAWTFADAPNFGTAQFYLQVSDIGGVYTLSESSDGTNFTSVFSGAYTGTDPLTQVGMVFYGCEGASSVPQIAQVSNFTVAATPEPATMALLAIGAVGLIRRKKA